ncbi:MAG: SsrA-binding protein SmpB [Patescibacteria group bacterium]|nr:SsrA-binding protein SmpB [Patescibacteria group bacterium]
MKILATNRRAKHDYELKDKFEAGLVLSGAEVKSIKAGHIDLKGSYISLKSGEAYLVKAHISPYKQAMGLDSYDPEAERKLLLHKSEINKILEDIQSQHLSVVPTAVGLSKGRIKLEIALARGKKLYDKREDKKRDSMLRDARIENSK